MRGAARGMDPYRAALAVVTPSANRVVERVTTALLADFSEVSGHFSRTPVFGSSDPYPDDYDWAGMMGAVRLLAHASPDIILWSGSKGATLGFDVDRDFCRRVTAETGIPATTSTLALHDILARKGLHRLALVTPYGSAYQQKLVAGFVREGYAVVAEAHAGLADNLAFASIPQSAIEDMCGRVAEAKPDAILTWCTNFPAAYAVAAIEARLGVPVYDSVTLAAWHGLKTLGAIDGRGGRWGSLFAEPLRHAGSASR